MRKKRPYCVSTCVCFCNTAHSLNKGPRMCAIRAPAFAPNSPIICATVSAIWRIFEHHRSGFYRIQSRQPGGSGVQGHGKGTLFSVRDLKAAKDFP